MDSRAEKKAGKRGDVEKKTFNKSLAESETFEEEDEEPEQTFTIGNSNPTVGNFGEDEDENDANGWKKKKKSGGFQRMGLSQEVIKGILRRGYKVTTPIQRKVI